MDDPAGIKKGIRQGAMIQAFYRKIETLQRELLIESAYFVTQDKGIEDMKKLTERGVRVRVLTNSLASNDVVAAHAGHAKRREQLVANGMELYELRPDAGAIKQRVFSGHSKAALHTKAVVFDREAVFIGSFNLDPRSANINTEAGLYVESPELAQQVIAYMNEGVEPENCYRVLLDEDGDLIWTTEIDGWRCGTTRNRRPVSGSASCLGSSRCCRWNISCSGSRTRARLYRASAWSPTSTTTWRILPLKWNSPS